MNVSYQGVSEMMEFKVKQLTERLNLAEAALKVRGTIDKDGVTIRVESPSGRHSYFP